MNKSLEEMLGKAENASYNKFQLRREASAIIQDCVKEAYNLGRKDAFKRVLQGIENYQELYVLDGSAENALWDLRDEIKKDLGEIA